MKAEVISDLVFGCRLVVSPVDKDGYGRIGDRRAHIVAWEEANGRVPDGMEIEHECRRRACINVAHLRAVTRGENERRKKWRNRVRIATCKAGHDLSTAAMVTPEGGRICRVCSKGTER